MRTPQKRIDYQFMLRVLREETTPEEKEFFEDWLRESEGNRSEFATVTLLWDSMKRASVPESGTLEQQWKRTLGKLSAYEAAPEQSSGNQHPIFVRASVWRPMGIRELIVGGALILAVAGIILSSRYPFGGARQSPHQIVYSEVVTQKGERLVVTMTDGTVIHLNSGSRLAYPEQMSDTLRVVGLEGEGYFEVAHDSTRPFLIITGKTYTGVTGTEFNIRFRRDSLVVSVAKGSVFLAQRGMGPAVHLGSGEAAIYNRKGFSPPKHVDISRYVAWRKNKLAFSRTPLREVMDEIELCFNVQVFFGSTGTQNKTLTGVFSTESLDDVLAKIALVMDVDVRRKGKIINIQ
jgi:ferric-dicitrate binding protein FerR (iron transport regulator)